MGEVMSGESYGDWFRALVVLGASIFDLIIKNKDMKEMCENISRLLKFWNNMDERTYKDEVDGKVDREWDGTELKSLLSKGARVLWREKGELGVTV